jgi:hypothetical protein
MKIKFLVVLAVLFLLIQFFPAPSRSNPHTDPARTFAAVMKPPQAVQDVLSRACFDCHSHETNWPWYADIAPISWLIRSHVEEGRRHLNLSEWLKSGETAFSNWSDLEDICKSVRDNRMPLPYYDWLHPKAKLTNTDRQTVCAWVDAAIARGGK